MAARGVTKSFGAVVANRNISVRIEPGECVGLVGPNGSGKTTLLNVIAGLHRPDSGEIYIGDVDATGLSSDQVCKLGVARTFQLMRLFLELTARDNVLVGALLHTKDVKVGRRAADRCLAQVGLTKKADDLAKNLSTGQRKRLELARVMATEPDLILLDEVLAGIDPGSREPVLSVLGGLRQEGKTLLMVEHNLDVVSDFCGRVVALDQGEIVSDGMPSEVLGDERVIASYIGTEYVEGS